MKKQIAIAVLAGMSAIPSLAQASEWDFVFAPYIWAADTKGNTVTKGLPADIDIKFWDDIAPNLKAAFEFHFEAKNADQPVDYIVDATWLEMASSSYTGAGVKVRPELETVILDLKVAGDIADIDGFQWVAGTRYFQNDISVKITPPGFKGAVDKDWADLIVGLRYIGDLGNNWNYALSGDVGGFNLSADTDRTWQVSAALGWRFAENAEAAFGYRVLDVNYSDGNGFSKYTYDVRMKGPMMGVIFHF